MADQSLDILPVPFLIVELVDGADAEAIGLVPPASAGAWQEPGADLARLHRFAPSAARAAPGLAWGERPVAWLTDLVLHLHGRQDQPRRDLAPAAGE